MKKILILIIIGYGIYSLFGDKSVEKYYSETEQLDSEKIMGIEKSLFFSKTKNWDSIVNVLESVINNIPEGYVNSFESGKKYYVKFWSQQEYLKYKEEVSDDIVYLQNTYPYAYYLYAVVHIETGNFDRAFEALDKGLELDSLSPVLLSEMGMLLTHLASDTKNTDNYNASNQFYSKAFDSRHYNTNGQKQGH